MAGNPGIFQSFAALLLPGYFSGFLALTLAPAKNPGRAVPADLQHRAVAIPPADAGSMKPQRFINQLFGFIVHVALSLAG